MKQAILKGALGAGLLLTGLVVLPSAAGAAAKIVPNAPTGVSAVAGGTKVTVSWTASTVPAGGLPVTSYKVAGIGPINHYPCVTGATITTCTATLPPTNPKHPAGITYSIKVQALNAVGHSAWSSTVPVLFGVPSAPVGVTAVAGSASALVSWTAGAPASHPTSRYTVTAVPGGQTCSTTATAPAVPATSCTVTGLATGVSTSFSVTATNVVGTGVPGLSTAITIPLPDVVPAAPTQVTASVAAGSTSAALVNFTAPAPNGGSPITGYTAIVDDTTSSTVTTFTGPPSAATNGISVTGLNTTDTYTFSVYATNGAGNGPASVPVAGDPASPSSVTPTNDGVGGATVAWTASPMTLGTPVTGFRVSSIDLTTFTLGPSATVSSSTSSATLSGLNIGDLYDVCVTTESALASQSETCVEFTTYPPPSGPATVTPTNIGDGTGSVSWTAPTTVPAGNPVTGFRVSTLDLTTFTLGQQFTVSNSTFSAALTGLTIGDLYDVCIASLSAYATDQTSTCVEFTAYAPPGGPATVTPTSNGDGTGSVSWTAPTTVPTRAPSSRGPWPPTRCAPAGRAGRAVRRPSRWP